MTQISFQNRVAQIEAKHAQPKGESRRGLFRCGILVLWVGFFALAAGLWHNGSISAQHIASLFPDTQDRVLAQKVPHIASLTKPASERQDGARWESVSNRSQSKRAFFSLSTKGSMTSLNTGGDFVDFIEMKVDRQKNSKNKGRLGFEGQNAVADRRRDQFWLR